MGTKLFSLDIWHDVPLDFCYPSSFQLLLDWEAVKKITICQMSNVYTTCSLERSGNDILAFKLPILVEETSHHVIKVYCQHHCLYTSV